MFIITRNGSGAPPDADYCAETRERFDLPMPVLYDPTGSTLAEVLEAPANRDLDFVLGEGAEIVLRLDGGGSGRGGGEATVGPVIEELLGR